MKISELIVQLEEYKKHFGDDEVEFWLRQDGDRDSIECDLEEIHDGYSSDGRECELRIRAVSN